MGPILYVRAGASASHAPQIASTWRWSVPQQPPRTFTPGRRDFSAAWRSARSAGSPSSSSSASSSSAWLFVEAFVRRPPIRRTHGCAARDRLLEVRRVGAVDHVVGGAPLRRVVDLLDRAAERLPARQAAVGLERERDHRRQPGRRGSRVTPIASSA